MAERVLNLIPGDIGRPISQIKPNINCPDLENLIHHVIDTIEVHQRDVRDVQGRVYSLTIRPYKSVDNRIDGAVLVLYDIDEVRRHEDQAHQSREYAEAVFNTVREPLVVLDCDLRVQRVNPAFSSMFVTSSGDVEGRLLYELAGGQWNIAGLRKLLDEIVPTGAPFENFAVELEVPGASQKKFRLSGRRITGSDKRPALILLAIDAAE